jgi:hypothetical protein
MQLVDHTATVVTGQILEAPLQHATTVRVNSKLASGLTECPQERKAFWRYRHDELLNYLFIKQLGYDTELWTLQRT